MGLNHLNSA